MNKSPEQRARIDRGQNRTAEAVRVPQSKKWIDLKAAIALHFALYNFVRRHQSLRMTPAMAAGITDHMWTMRELLEAV